MDDNKKIIDSIRTTVSISRYERCPYCNRKILKYSFEEHKELCKNVDINNLMVKRPKK